MSITMNNKKNREAAREFHPSGFAINLKHYRILKGLSSAEMGDALGLDHTTIIKYEQGLREPRLSMVRIIANFLGVTCDELLDNGDIYN